MSNLKIRPRFNLESKLSDEEVKLRIFSYFENPDVKCNADFLGSNVVIELPISERNFWTPQLSLSIYEEDNITKIRGSFGPASSPWLIYLIVYSALGIMALAIGIYGGTRLQLGKDAEILWTLPVILFAALMMYVISLYGQKKSRFQMQSLKEDFEAALNLKITN
jgi:hypothetical protein